MGHYYGPEAIFFSAMASVFLSFIGAFCGWSIGECGAAKGRSVMDSRDFGAGAAVAIAGVVLFVLACLSNFTLPLGMMVMALFVPVFVGIVSSDLYYKQHVPMWISVADELADKGSSIIEILDADGDGVVSRIDVKARRTEALAKGISSALLSQLANSMDDYGHNVGSEGSSCYVLGAKDLSLAPTRVRDKYQGWAEAYIPSAVA